jgi:type 1 glutamine amidotransferase
MLEGVSRERVVVVTGCGAHTDRWHDLYATGAAVAELFAERFEVSTATTDELVGIADAGLIVLDVAGDLEREPVDSRSVVGALLAAHAGGSALLALHSSSLAFRDDPRWAQVLGGRWVPDVSDHPPIGDAVLRVIGGAPFGDAGEFELFDERYTALERRPGTLLVAEHTEADVTHPLVWARDPADGARVVYNALGHDIRSYESAGHRRLLTASAAWLLAT